MHINQCNTREDLNTIDDQDSGCNSKNIKNNNIPLEVFEYFKKWKKMRKPSVRVCLKRWY